MPNIENQEKRYKKPTTLDREQLEYTIASTLHYSVLIFATVLGCLSFAYMAYQKVTA